MLTKRQLATLRTEPGTNRVAKAIDLMGVTQVTVAEALGLPQPYVSDVARRRYRTITVENARKFAKFFGCSIEDLFPSGSQRES
jgi:plasmid maintenance system antidote protein VapI